MEQEQGREYAWLLLWALARYRRGDDGAEGPEMTSITAVAGKLRRPQSTAANDLAARLLILLWFLWLSGAKSGAKTAMTSPVSCKMAAVTFFCPTAPQAASMLALRVSALLCGLCQNDHLPT